MSFRFALKEKMDDEWKWDWEAGFLHLRGWWMVGTTESDTIQYEDSKGFKLNQVMFSNVAANMLNIIRRLNTLHK